MLSHVCKTNALPGVVLALALALAATACTGPGPKKVGDANIPILVAGFDEVPADAADAPTVIVLPDTTPTIPDAPVVKIAADRQVSWGMIKAIVDRMESQGQTPIMLVTTRDSVKMLRLSDELIGPTIEVRALVGGKLCVWHPAASEMKCTQTASKKYIDGSHTRELTREAVLGYQRADILVDLPLALNWGDAVTAIGATRSCCGSREVRVALLPDDME